LKRSVEDYKHYTPPEQIKKLIDRPYGYHRMEGLLEARDRALLALLYITASRIREIVGGPTVVGELPPVRAEQFSLRGSFLYIRGLPVIKHRFNKGKPITSVEEYPRREEIPIPLEGPLGWIGEYIENRLKTVKSGPLFYITPVRAYQITRRKTGEFPHYFRDMGLKLWFRLLGDPWALKQFSGHARWENLEKYMRTTIRVEKTMLKFRG